MQDIIHKINQIIIFLQKHILLQIFSYKLKQTKKISNHILKNHNIITQSDKRYYIQTQLDNY